MILLKGLENFKPSYEFFVGIDSDGSVFNTMEIKQRECFLPTIIEHWGLEKIAKYVEEILIFLSLYSPWRGSNRWIILIKLFELLNQRYEIKEMNLKIPKLNSIKSFIEEHNKTGLPLSNEGLKNFIKKEKDKERELKKCLEWSKILDERIRKKVKNIPPFPYVEDILKFLKHKADIIVISGTPLETLYREWEENNLSQYVELIAGQEMGNKKAQLKYIWQGKYDKEKSIIIGDSPGDLETAKTYGIKFYPIIPKKEIQSWKKFYEESMYYFLEGKYTKDYEKNLIKEFKESLSDTPPWKIN